eukprot:scaffold3036_cov414-Prasinococcus_capsulatus_cf.AAC.1
MTAAGVRGGQRQRQSLQALRAHVGYLCTARPTRTARCRCEPRGEKDATAVRGRMLTAAPLRCLNSAFAQRLHAADVGPARRPRCAEAAWLIHMLHLHRLPEHSLLVHVLNSRC